jgi:outer membrane immunogenic protein
MRRLRLAALAVGALVGVSGVAFAADIPFKALPPPVPLFVWTGFYGGANVGYSWGGSTTTTDVPSIPATYSDGVWHRGWEASVEGGFCYQQSPTTIFVACLEVRYDFPAERSQSTTTGTIFPGTATTTTVTTTTHIDPLLIGPHLGFTTNANSTFWYAAGGLAMGEVGGTAIGTGLLGTSTANPANTWATGWFVGAGVEQMFNNNWGVKVEYDYVSLGTGGVTAPYAGTNTTLNPSCVGTFAVLTCPPATATVATHPFDNVVTVGINYHFH